MKKELISIIIPVYNASKFILDTLDSVVNQTYKDWELILVDDLSTDNSCEIIKSYQKDHKNLDIKLIKLKEKGMAAGARNKGIEIAKGRYICFLDADDSWNNSKLEKQLKFMNNKKCAFSYTGYEFADETLKTLGVKVKVPTELTYNQALKNTIIWTTTVMFDTKLISKELIKMPNVKSEDTATWWKILKAGYIAYGLDEILAYYRRSEGTLSSNKIEAIKRIWNLYRNVEHLNIFKSIYCFCFYAINTVKKRI